MSASAEAMISTTRTEAFSPTSTSSLGNTALPSSSSQWTTTSGAATSAPARTVTRQGALTKAPFMAFHTSARGPASAVTGSRPVHQRPVPDGHHLQPRLGAQ